MAREVPWRSLLWNDLTLQNLLNSKILEDNTDGMTPVPLKPDEQVAAESLGKSEDTFRDAVHQRVLKKKSGQQSLNGNYHSQDRT